MNTISHARVKVGDTTTGYELWQTLDGGYRLRTWHRSPSGMVASPHSVTLTEQQLEQIAEDIHTFLFAEQEFDDEVQQLVREHEEQ
jgi:hypothetical protein